jgi:hypothetical protein
VLESCDTAIRLNPRYVEGWDKRGAALQDLNRPEEALQSGETAIALGFRGLPRSPCRCSETSRHFVRSRIIARANFRHHSLIDCICKLREDRNSSGAIIDGAHGGLRLVLGVGPRLGLEVSKPQCDN